MGKLQSLFQVTLLSLGLISPMALAEQQFKTETPKAAKSIAPLKGGVNVTQIEGALSQYSGWGFFCARSKVELPANVILVEPGTPAYAKGVLAGDKILKVQATKTGITLTIERGSKMYAAELTNDQLASGADRNALNGGLKRFGLVGHAQRQQLQGNVWQRTLARPLIINIGSGGGEFTNSFNGARTVHDLMMGLADRFAQALNSAKLPPGATGIVVVINKPHDPDVNIGDNGDAVTAFFSDCTVDRIGAFSDPEKAKIDAVIDQKRLTLTPLDLTTEAGGSRVVDSFNNGSGPSILDFTDLSSYQSPAYATLKAGGQLAERPSVVLRPTIHEFSLPGSTMANSFDKDISGADASGQMDRQAAEGFLQENPRFRNGRRMPVDEQERATRRMQSMAMRDLSRSGTRTRGEHTCRLQVVPDRTIPGLTRPVMFKIGLGGSRIANSFNHAGSVTILANEFLDRLSRQVKPSVLAGIEMLHFSHGGSFIENSFDAK